jgi:hypothetical protein
MSLLKLPFELPFHEVLKCRHFHPAEIAKQLNSSSGEALVACTLSSETHRFIDIVDKMRKPLKGMVFTNGPADLVST